MYSTDYRVFTSVLRIRALTVSVFPGTSVPEAPGIFLTLRFSLTRKKSVDFRVNCGRLMDDTHSEPRPMSRSNLYLLSPSGDEILQISRSSTNSVSLYIMTLLNPFPTVFVYIRYSRTFNFLT